MGLSISHNCWSGSYSSFHNWRSIISQAAGYGDLNDYLGFGGRKFFTDQDPLIILLNHSDCDGSIDWEDCASIALRLEEVLNAILNSKVNTQQFSDVIKYTQRFIAGLTLAHIREENVEFR